MEIRIDQSNIIPTLVLVVLGNITGLAIWEFFKSGLALKLGEKFAWWLMWRTLMLRHWVIKHLPGYWSIEVPAENCEGGLLRLEPDLLTLDFGQRKQAVLTYNPSRFLAAIRDEQYGETPTFKVRRRSMPVVAMARGGTTATREYEVEIYISLPVKGSNLMIVLGQELEQKLYRILSTRGKVIYFRD